MCPGSGCGSVSPHGACRRVASGGITSSRGDDPGSGRAVAFGRGDVASCAAGVALERIHSPEKGRPRRRVARARPLVRSLRSSGCGARRTGVTGHRVTATSLAGGHICFSSMAGHCLKSAPRMGSATLAAVQYDWRVERKTPPKRGIVCWCGRLTRRAAHPRCRPRRTAPLRATHGRRRRSRPRPSRTPRCCSACARQPIAYDRRSAPRSARRRCGTA